jgi:hypothetical protein
MQLSPEQLTNPIISKVKEVFDATVERVWKDESPIVDDSDISGIPSASGNS